MSYVLYKERDYRNAYLEMIQESSSILNEDTSQDQPTPIDTSEFKAWFGNSKVKDSDGAIGFINGRSSIFCQDCNRLRLTSDGKLMPCLYSAHTYDLKRLIRNRASDRQMRDLLKRIISEKGNYTKLSSFKEEFSMCKVGG